MRASSDETASTRLPLGVLVPNSGLAQGALAATGVAIDAINAARPNWYPELVAVACPEQDGAAIVHLMDAGVRIFIGPLSATEVDAVRGAVAERGVLFSPLADAPSLTRPTGGASATVVSCKASRGTSSTPLLAAARYFLGNLKETGRVDDDASAVIALSEQETDLGYTEVFNASEVAVVPASVLEYGADGADLNAALDRAGFSAGLLIAPSGEAAWGRHSGKLDELREAREQPLPFYLLRDKQAEAMDLIPRNRSRSERVLGLQEVRTARHRSIEEEFARSFVAATGSAAAPELAYIYDCVHVAAYAAAAGLQRFGQPVHSFTISALLGGLAALQGGEALAVGALEASTAFLLLGEARGYDDAIDLVGATGDLDLQLPPVSELIREPNGNYLSPIAADEEFYCANPDEGGFCDTGVIVRKSGGAPSGDSQCPCFRYP